MESMIIENEFDEVQREKILNDGLLTADKFINKKYLINISEQNVIPLDDERKNINSIRLFEIEKLIFDKKENINDKLISVYSALQDIQGSVILLLKGGQKKITFYIGVRTNEAVATASLILEKSFEGNFSGSSLRRLKNNEISQVMSSIVETNYVHAQKSVSCVTVVPSMRDEDKDKFVQGIEKFIDTMQGEEYTALLVANPVLKEELEIRKRGYEELYTSLSPFQKTSLAYGENYSEAVSKGMFENFSASINESVTNTTGNNVNNSSSVTDGTQSGMSYNQGGIGYNRGKSHSDSKGYSVGKSWSDSVTKGAATTVGSGTNDTNTKTVGNSRVLTVENTNKSVSILLEQIDAQLERIKTCESFGVWECAAYFVANNIQLAVTAANSYKALMLGDDTDVENSFVNVWSGQTSEQTSKVLEYLKYGIHPLVEIFPEQGYDKQFVTPANFISGKEMPLLMGLPHKSVSGLVVSEIARFGRNVFMQTQKENPNTIRIGQIYHMGKKEKNEVNLELQSFVSHCFITGSTGSGKSNTTYCLLEKFIENQIPFLVIEPAKGEYKNAFGDVKDINIFSTNPLIGQMLKLNPFKFDNKIHILEHLDRLIEIFNTCWEMYAAMPAILKDAIEKIYVYKGWDLLNSVYLGEGEPVYPTFNDLMRVLPKIIQNSNYSSDTKGDYVGALVTRVTSLTNGISGQVFCDNYDISDDILFNQNTIVDLSRVGASETKSLIMGVLILRLSEYRMANSASANSRLKHITVLEEAHNILKKTQPGQAGNNVVGKSVEMICNSIAEMRTYGEGFVIVDQSPTAVDVAAIKNTNTKILMRLPEREDCEVVGNSVGLSNEQINELSKLNTGVAVVMQNNWLESVLTKIDSSSNKYFKTIKNASFEEIKRLRGIVVKELMDQYIVNRQMDLEKMQKLIMKENVIMYKKKEMMCCVENIIMYLSKERSIDFFCDSLMKVCGIRNLFDILSSKIKQKDGEFIEENLIDWKDQIKEKMDDYLVIPENYKFTLLEYLLFSLGSENTSIDYEKIRQIIYERK